MHPIGTSQLGVLCAWLLASNALFADDWPQWLGPNRDAVWREGDDITNRDLNCIRRVESQPATVFIELR